MRKCFNSVIAFVLVFSLIILNYPVSASASTFGDDNVMIDVLALQDRDSFYFYPNSTSYDVHFSIPTSYFQYIDILFYTSYVNPKVYFESVYLPLNVIHVADTLYRAYGTISGASNDLHLIFAGDNAAASFSIVSCKYSTVKMAGYRIGGSFAGYNTGSNYFEGFYNGTNLAFIPAFNNIVDNTGLENYYPFSFNIYPDTNGWKRWDKISIRLSLTGLNITSISCVVLGVNCLESINFLDNSFAYNEHVYAEFPDQTFFELFNNAQYVDLILDLTKISKLDSYPVITITGSYSASSSKSVLGYVYDSFGFIMASNDDPVIFWFRKSYLSLSNGFSNLISNLSSWFSTNFQWLSNIYTGIQSIITGSSQDNNNALGFNSEVDQQGSELDEMTNVMTSVEKPDLNSVNMSVSGMVNPSVITLSTSGISSVLGNEVIIRVLVIAFTFGLVGFILYGKKG